MTDQSFDSPSIIQLGLLYDVFIFSDLIEAKVEIFEIFLGGKFKKK